MRSSLSGGFHGFEARTQAAQLRHKYPNSFWLRTRTAKALQLVLGMALLSGAVVKGHSYFAQTPNISSGSPELKEQVEQTKNEVGFLLTVPPTFPAQESK